jgi:hypothetical protein
MAISFHLLAGRGTDKSLPVTLRAARRNERRSICSSPELSAMDKYFLETLVKRAGEVQKRLRIPASKADTKRLLSHPSRVCM